MFGGWSSGPANPAPCHGPLQPNDQNFGRKRSLSILSDIDIEEEGRAIVELNMWSAKLLEATASTSPASSALQSRPMVSLLGTPVPTAPQRPAPPAPCGSGRPWRSCECFVAETLGAGPGLLSDAVSQWFTAGAGAAHSGCVAGTMTTCGKLGITASKELSSALRIALAKVVGPAAGKDAVVRVFPCPASREAKVGVDGFQHYEFGFEVHVADRHDLVPAQEVLRLESLSAGARRLMPAFIDALSAAHVPGVPHTLRLAITAVV